MDTTYKDEIGYSLKPVVDYVVGVDDLYLCSPIPSEAGHLCIRLEELSFTDPGMLGDGFLVLLLGVTTLRLSLLSFLSQNKVS